MFSVGYNHLKIRIIVFLCCQNELFISKEGTAESCTGSALQTCTAKLSTTIHLLLAIISTLIPDLSRTAYINPATRPEIKRTQTISHLCSQFTQQQLPMCFHDDDDVASLQRSKANIFVALSSNSKATNNVILIVANTRNLLPNIQLGPWFLF